MPDMNRADGSRDIAVIGAGISGLVAAKVFSAAGHRVTVFEQSPEIGGVWAPSRSYPGVQTQTPRDLYAFSDFPMPRDYPEWPSGAQMHAYLSAYADRFELRPKLRLGTAVAGMTRRAGGGWTLRLRDAAGERDAGFDRVAIGAGQFSRPHLPALPGAFDGAVMHSSAFNDAAAATGRDVVVLGFSKSATDVAMAALEAGATSVAIVFREATWKIPYFFGGLINFKNILYCRASEAMFLPWAPSGAGRLGRRLSQPMIWANWRALETLLDRQFGLTKLGLRPSVPIEGTIHCATSIETPGFYKAIRDGRIRAVRGTLAGLAPGAAVTADGTHLPAQLVVLATGWVQALPFLDDATQAALVDADGQFRLHRMLVHSNLPDLGFVGFNSSFATSLSAELGAHWLARFWAGRLARMPDAATMAADLDRVTTWKRDVRPVARQFGGLCVAPFHHAHFDELLGDIGAPTRGGNPVKNWLAPIDPAAYARLLAAAPPLQETVP